jgi:putative transposase
MAKRPPRSVPGQIVLRLIRVVLQFVAATCQSRAKLAAENLFLRKQLAMYLERQVKPGRPDDATRITLVILSRLLDWPRLLTIVKPDTLIAWHRQGFRLVWRWKSRAVGRPRIPERLQRLIADVATANPTWGEERIAAELLVKLGLRLSPRTVRRYMPRRASPRGRRQFQTWTTFVKNHANVTLACDFFVTITATFRVLYGFVVLESGTRRLMHWNVTKHPSAEWTLQQFRMLLPGDQRHRLVIHDRDSTLSATVDQFLVDTGLTVLKTSARERRRRTLIANA